MLKAIIVDDEAPARSELNFLLEEIGQIEVVAEAANVREAIEKLRDIGADILFLDINMPGANGLTLAEALTRLKYPPYVIFVTAYSEFAVKAFEVNAADYLVKPVETERLRQAINKVYQLIASQGKSTASERIPVDKGNKKMLIPANKIRYIMAKDDYSYLYTDTDRFLSTDSLSDLEKMLEPFGFFRVHRGYLVNLDCVSEVESEKGGRLALTLQGEEEKIVVSRRRAPAFKKALGL